MITDILPFASSIVKVILGTGGVCVCKHIYKPCVIGEVGMLNSHSHFVYGKEHPDVHFCVREDVLCFFLLATKSSARLA